MSDQHPARIQSGRAYLTERLSPRLPGAWKVIPYDANIDVPETPVVLYRVQSFTKHPAAPASTFLATWTLTVICPTTDPARRDDDADDAAMTLIEALTGARIPWGTAEKALWGKSYVCYDIDIKLPTAREIPAPPTTETITTEQESTPDA